MKYVTIALEDPQALTIKWDMRVGLESGWSEVEIIAVGSDKPGDKIVGPFVAQRGELKCRMCDLS